MIVQDLKREKEIFRLVQKVLDKIKDPLSLANRSIEVMASAGIAFYPGDGKTPDVLLRNADLAMYRAKELGGNQGVDHSLRTISRA